MDLKEAKRILAEYEIESNISNGKLIVKNPHGRIEIADDGYVKIYDFNYDTPKEWDKNATVDTIDEIVISILDSFKSEEEFERSQKPDTDSNLVENDNSTQIQGKYNSPSSVKEKIKDMLAVMKELWYDEDDTSGLYDEIKRCLHGNCTLATWNEIKEAIENQIENPSDYDALITCWEDVAQEIEDTPSKTVNTNKMVTENATDGGEVLDYHRSVVFMDGYIDGPVMWKITMNRNFIASKDTYGSYVLTIGYTTKNGQWYQPDPTMFFETEEAMNEVVDTIKYNIRELGYFFRDMLDQDEEYNDSDDDNVTENAKRSTGDENVAVYTFGFSLDIFLFDEQTMTDEEIYAFNEQSEKYEGEMLSCLRTLPGVLNVQDEGHDNIGRIGSITVNQEGLDYIISHFEFVCEGGFADTEFYTDIPCGIGQVYFFNVPEECFQTTLQFLENDEQQEDYDVQ